jgi:23S rRNA (adenine2503-C2)-methyltransferase
MQEKIDLLDKTVAELEEMLSGIGQQKFRAKQIFQWLGRGIKDIDDMTDLSKALRQRLKDIAYIDSLEIVNKLVSKIDGTTKYLFKLKDGNIIESVLMDYKHGFTVCISSQVGCRMGCKFCASTGISLVRNLSAGEMLNQVLSIQSDEGIKVGNIVIMGIGEPMDNYYNVVKFLNIAHDLESLNISYRRMTVSTCGLVPGILKLSQEKLPINLAISLHAPNDEIRDTIMPVNKKYSIDKMIEACKIYTEATKRRITFEYAMIAGINDSIEHAIELARRIKGMLCHVNLIPVNTIEHAEFKQSDRKHIEKFKEILERHGIDTTVRRELGEDINAACGQLRRSIIEN